MDDTKLRVLIVGASVAGLTLANMLELAGIDYLVLEGHEEIAPQIGASIGVFANGMRILDQLGCAEGLLDLIDMPLDNVFIQNSDGSVIKHMADVHDRGEARHGYPTIFIDRQMLLQRLYANLESKERILPGKKVKSIDTIENSVQITTASGEVFHGDILVGADGIYSTVRQEMHRIAQKQSPAHFPVDEWSNVPCDYKCIFGISHPTPKLSVGGLHYVMVKHRSYLFITGPKGRVYWFLYQKLPTTMYGNEIPRYTKEDELALAAKNAFDPITTDITFGEIYAGRTSSVLTPLHEYAFKKWHYKRAITIGDSAHKFEPITGQGGNNAIESAASFVNNLTAKIRDGKLPLTNQDVEEVFEKTQEQRFERVSHVISLAHKRQQVDALETPIHEFLAKTLPLVLPREIAEGQFDRTLIDAEPLDIVPKPVRPHSRPWNDELPAKPFSSSWILGGIGIFSQAFLFWLAGKALPSLTMPADFMGTNLKKEYVHIKSVDKILSSIVSAFGGVLTPSNPEARAQLTYFIPVIMSSVLDWTVEAYRPGNGMLPTGWPSIFGAAYQLHGIGRIAPLYNAINIACSATFHIPGINAGRTIPAEVSKALVPGILGGYLLPSVLMLYPFKNADTWQNYVALWQPFPIFVGALTAGLSKIYATKKPKSDEKHESPGKQKGRREAGLQTLRRVYALGFRVSALWHACSMVSIWNTPGQSLSQVFGNLGSPFANRPENIPLFFKWDLALNCASVAVQSVYRIWELRSYGYITSAAALKATLLSSLGTITVGPAAVQIGIMAWREETMVALAR